MEINRFLMPTEWDSITTSKDTLLARLLAAGYTPEQVENINVVLIEALQNAKRHGNKDDFGKIIEIVAVFNEKWIVCSIRDQGSGFCLQEIPDPTKKENWGKPSGRGILYYRMYAHFVQFNREGTEVTLVIKNQSGAKQGMSDLATAMQA